MKRLLLLALCAISSFYAQSQTKGTNAIGFGIGSSSWESDFQGSTNEQKGTNVSLTYGNFIRDNIKLSITGSYSHTKSESSDSPNYSYTDGYGGGLAYQKYFPVYKKFFVYAGARTYYEYSENKYTYDGQSETSGKNNLYSVGASGGVAYFLSKRFAFEAQLLGANASYLSSKSVINDAKQTQKHFNLSSSGSINNFAFQIYFLF